MKKYPYTLIFLLPLTVYLALTQMGWVTHLPKLVFYGIVPLLELILKPDPSNLSQELELKWQRDPFFDRLLYAVIPFHIGLLIYFFFVIGHTPAGTTEFYGRISAVGLMLGVTGINLGHELGHRHNRLQQFLGEILLLTSLNTHFLPYHNAGHHRNVATRQDPATARKNEILFWFWLRSQIGGYIQAWQIELKRMQKLGRAALSLHNRMVVYTIAQMLLLVAIYLIFGLKVLLAFVLAATIGIILLETVNYIEHYGLLRQRLPNGKYERVNHTHSWNSDHLLGRFLLFNLSRHSDHHYHAGKKYQVLRSLPASPQMPTGYPGMMLLALVQPLWFYIMNKKLQDVGQAA